MEIGHSLVRFFTCTIPHACFQRKSWKSSIFVREKSRKCHGNRNSKSCDNPAVGELNLPLLPRKSRCVSMPVSRVAAGHGCHDGVSRLWPHWVFHALHCKNCRRHIDDNPMFNFFNFYFLQQCRHSCLMKMPSPIRYKVRSKFEPS